MKRTNQIKAPLVFCLSIVLLCVLFFTYNMMGGVYARYSATATGTASARAADFDVDTNCSYDPSTDQYVLTIVNGSEVTVSYNVSFTVDGAVLPSGVAITLEGIGNSGVLAQGESVSSALSFSEDFNSFHEDIVIDAVINVSQVD